MGLRLSVCCVEMLRFCCVISDLHVIHSSGFGIILGMMWLNKYEAHIICSERSIYLRHPESEDRVSIILDRVEPSLKASLFALESSEESGIARIPIVCDYADIFAPISGLPPKRAIEFRIDLVPGAQPVNLPPTRMAAKENEELVKQLTELEAKQLIQLSSSPWGAAVVFVKKLEGTLQLCIDY